MARSPSRGILPHIRTTYDDSFQPVVRYVTPTGRWDDTYESRMAQLEASVKNLLDKAIKMKAEIMENMSYTHGTWQEEKDARELLQDHIRTVTSVVKQMSKDMKHLEGEIQARDQGIQGAGNALKTLETHHVAGVTDLRGRVARCDASIGKLSSDLKQTTDSIRMMATSENEEHQRLRDKVSQLERGLMDMNGLLERVGIENSLQVRQSEENTNKNLGSLDSKTRQVIQDLSHQIQSLTAHINAEMEKLETRIYAYLDKHIAARDARIDKTEADHLDFEKNIFARLAALEEDHQRHKGTVSRSHQELEQRIQHFYDSFYKSQNSEVSKMKREMRDGFSTVHETVNSMRIVVEGKQKLLEEGLRKDIAQIRKMVVLI